MENNLVFKGENGKVLTTSLKVAETFGKEHKNVLKDIRELNCSENFRLLNFEQSEYLNEQKHKQPMFIMTKDGFILLAMGYTGKKAMGFKEKYIAAFNQMEQMLIELKEQKTPKVPTSFAQALYLAAKQQEQIEEQNKQIEALNDEVIELKKKTDYLEVILQSKETVAIGQIAADYGMTSQAMNSLLAEMHIQHKVNGQWLLYADYVKNGYTHSETIPITHSDGRKDVRMFSKWRQSGRIFLYNKLKERNIVPLIEK